MDKLKKDDSTLQAQTVKFILKSFETPSAIYPKPCGVIQWN